MWEHLYRHLLLCAGAAVFQCLFLYRLPRRHRLLRPVPGHLHGPTLAGAWDQTPKKIVEVDLRQKGTELHAATVRRWTPLVIRSKDTSSVALNPVIKIYQRCLVLLAVGNCGKR